MSIVKKDPHYLELMVMYEKGRKNNTPADIYKKWKRLIKPDTPSFTAEQFARHVYSKNRREKDSPVNESVVETLSPIVEKVIMARDASLVELEQGIRRVTGDLLNEAGRIARNAQNMTSKDKYFALGVVEKTWGKIQKEKDIAIKAHAEKRESVGMFAKLLRGAMSGEFTMQDIEQLKQTHGSQDLPVAGIEADAPGTAQATA